MSLLALLVSTALAATNAPAVTVGKPALLFVLPAINEDVAFDLVNRPTVALSDFAGIRAPKDARAVVVHFFDREHGGDALQTLNRIQKRYHNKGVQVIAVSTDSGDLGGVFTWIEDQKLAFPVLRDSHRVVVGRWGIEAVPMTVVVDGDGYVFAIGQPMGDEFEAALTAEIEPLLGR